MAHHGEDFCYLGLADASIALEQQRSAEVLHQQKRGHEPRLRDVAGAREILLHRSQLQHALGTHVLFAPNNERSQSLITAQINASAFSCFGCDAITGVAGALACATGMTDSLTSACFACT
jgi:hypothetical protein